MAWVFQAYDPALERQVAVKVIKPQYTPLLEPTDAPGKEAHIIARLEHPNILSVYGRGEQTLQGQRIVYLVMQLAKTETLRERIRGHRLTFMEAGHILAQVCAALDYAHDHEVIHLDIKPSNILFDERDNALVSDFGLAKQLKGASRIKVESLSGTPAYMPPERLSSQEIGRFSDVYSLGITLYEMLTGELPEIDWPQQWFAVPSGHPLPASVQAVIERATALAPEQRYATVGELAQAFKEALPLPPVPGNDREILIPEPSPAYQWALRAGLGVALLVVLAMTGAISSKAWQRWLAFSAAPMAPALAVSASPTLSIPPTATQTTTPAPSPSLPATSTATPTSSPTPIPTPTPTSTPWPAPLFKVGDESVPVYTGPGENHDLLTEVHRGDELPLTGRSEDKEWWQVDYHGLEGWINANTPGEINIDPSLLPVVEVPPTPTAPPTPTEEPTATPLPPNTRISLLNPGFANIADREIPGWTWWAEDTYTQGDDPNVSFETPLIKQADDPARMINGATLQIDAAGHLKFLAHVYQSVSVPVTTSVRFQVRAAAYSDEGKIKVAAGIDPEGSYDCSAAQWGDTPKIDQDSGVVQLVAPDVVVGRDRQVTVCLYAETTLPARSNAAFFDDAELLANPQ
jgi:serine/threonine protein kinase